MKINIMETGKRELAKLDLDVEECQYQVTSFIPKPDLIGMGHIFTTGKPVQISTHAHRAWYAEAHLKGPELTEVW
jgi:hypothetical protein